MSDFMPEKQLCGNCGKPKEEHGNLKASGVWYWYCKTMKGKVFEPLPPQVEPTKDSEIGLVIDGKIVSLEQMDDIMKAEPTKNDFMLHTNDLRNLNEEIRTAREIAKQDLINRTLYSENLTDEEIKEIQKKNGCFLPEIWKCRTEIASTPLWLREYFKEVGKKQKFPLPLETELIAEFRNKVWYMLQYLTFSEREAIEQAARNLITKIEQQTASAIIEIIQDTTISYNQKALLKLNSISTEQVEKQLIENIVLRVKKHLEASK